MAIIWTASFTFRQPYPRKNDASWPTRELAGADRCHRRETLSLTDMQNVECTVVDLRCGQLGSSILEHCPKTRNDAPRRSKDAYWTPRQASKTQHDVSSVSNAAIKNTEPPPPTVSLYLTSCTSRTHGLLKHGVHMSHVLNAYSGKAKLTSWPPLALRTSNFPLHMMLKASDERSLRDTTCVALHPCLVC